MSLRPSVLVLAFVVACGGSDMKVRKGEPQTAREKMLAEEKAHPSDADEAPPDKKGGTSKKWTGWRYQGDRKDCFFVVGKKCFKTENAACQAAHCKAPSKCQTEGAGPTTLTCSGAKKRT
ncbi:MAG TPA: hypothetical protein VLB44_18600 [Kofleriaceae bacterium]|nr:hypothetical protein [Kofleriaceae bacterium]